MLRSWARPFRRQQTALETRYGTPQGLPPPHSTSHAGQAVTLGARALAGALGNVAIRSGGTKMRPPEGVPRNEIDLDHRRRDFRRNVCRCPATALAEEWRNIFKIPEGAKVQEEADKDPSYSSGSCTTAY
jgi:hypothetical protein